MICAPCGEIIGKGRKYVAVFATAHGLRLEVGCEHYTPPHVDDAVATLASGGCLARWFGLWAETLRCKHKGEAA